MTEKPLEEYLADISAAEAASDWDTVERLFAALPKEVRDEPVLMARHAVSVMNAGDKARAATMTRKAHRLDPENAHIQAQLGKLYLDQKRYDAAEKTFRDLLDREPENREALTYLSRVLLDRGENTPEAEEFARRAAEASPGDVLPLLQWAAIIANDPSRLDEAEVIFERALEISPDLPSALHNYGLIKRFKGELDISEDYLRRAIAVRPGDPSYIFSLGICLYFQERMEEALVCFRQSAEINPGDNPAKVYAAYALFHLGRDKEAWAEYENRLVLKDLREANFDRPRWDGGELNGETVLLIPEQGIGDNLQFIRYAEFVAEKGGSVWVATHKPLIRLFKSLRGVKWVSPTAPEAKNFHRYCPVMSLPYTFGTNADNVPQNVPYLQASRELVEQWGERISAHPGKKVGLCWRGNPKHVNDRFRSTSLEEMTQLLNVPGIAFFSLHKERPDFEQELPAGMVDIGTDFYDFADTAAAMAALDLVISVDTSVCHMAGAVGCPVWTMIPRGPDFRWKLTGDTTPWYPTMTLYRQEKLGDWSDVFERMKRDLAEKIVGA